MLSRCDCLAAAKVTFVTLWSIFRGRRVTVSLADVIFVGMAKTLKFDTVLRWCESRFSVLNI